MILRSRIVLPVSHPPIEDGAISIAGDKIIAVGRWKDLKREASKAIDLGDSIVLPGLINAHCHLDYTDMAGMIAPTSIFPDWIKAMLALKAQWSYTDYAASWLNGAKMLLRTGTTTVADIEAVPELLPDAWSATSLRVRSFLEMTCVKSGRSPESVVSEASDVAGKYGGERLSLSPHALYSTVPQLLELAAKTSRERHWQLTTHVAESEAEFEMYQYRRGPLFDWLKSQRDMTDCGAVSPVEQLKRCGMLFPGFLAVHVNYLGEGDARMLAENDCSVVHCPRSHAYFGHRNFPHDELAGAGVNVCLGTDSLASVASTRRQPAELNMFAELRRFAQANAGVEPERIVRMATINGAKALSMAGRIGELSTGADADLISVPFSGSLREAHSAVGQHAGDVSRAMIGGKWVFGNE